MALETQILVELSCIANNLSPTNLIAPIVLQWSPLAQSREI